MTIRQAILISSIIVVFGVLPKEARSQSLSVDGGEPSDAAVVASVQPISNYTRPTQRAMARNYLFDAFGPYPLGGAAISAGFSQLDNAPPEWKQGAEGFGKRVGSAFGMAAIGTTTRYTLAEVLREDTLYYRCECRGVLPRTTHAVISTLTARRGRDGHRVFSYSSLVAPYVGASVALYAWYPDRYGVKDALRQGSYTSLIHMGGNIAIEFLFSVPQSFLSRMHLGKLHGSRDHGSDH